MCRGVQKENSLIAVLYEILVSFGDIEILVIHL